MCTEWECRAKIDDHDDDSRFTLENLMRVLMSRVEGKRTMKATPWEKFAAKNLQT